MNISFFPIKLIKFFINPGKILTKQIREKPSKTWKKNTNFIGRCWWPFKKNKLPATVRENGLPYNVTEFGLPSFRKRFFLGWPLENRAASRRVICMRPRAPNKRESSFYFHCILHSIFRFRFPSSSFRCPSRTRFLFLFFFFFLIEVGFWPPAAVGRSIGARLLFLFGLEAAVEVG